MVVVRGRRRLPPFSTGHAHSWYSWPRPHMANMAPWRFATANRSEALLALAPLASALTHTYASIAAPPPAQRCVRPGPLPDDTVWLCQVPRGGPNGADRWGQGTTICSAHAQLTKLTEGILLLGRSSRRVDILLSQGMGAIAMHTARFGQKDRCMLARAKDAAYASTRRRGDVRLGGAGACNNAEH